jgi:hypothetical protein
MKRLIIGAIFASFLAGCAGARSGPPSSAFGGLVKYRAPRGWSERTQESGVVLSSGTATKISIELRDGDPNSDERVTELKERPAAGMAPLPAYESGRARVAGADRTLFLRIARSSPFEPGAAAPTYTDEFCIVPMGGRFLLLAFSAEDYGPPKKMAERLAAWRALLATVELPGAQPAAAAVFAETMSYFYGPATYTSADGKAYGAGVSLVKREVLPARDLIIETVIQPGRAPGERPRQIVTTLTRRAGTTVFDAADAAATFSGSLTFDGPEWAWTHWRYAIALKDGGRVTGDGRLGDDGVRTNKSVLDAKGVITVRVSESLAPVTLKDFQARRRELLGR